MVLHASHFLASSYHILRAGTFLQQDPGKLEMECREEQGQGGGVFLERKHQQILICKDLTNPSLQGH